MQSGKRSRESEKGCMVNKDGHACIRQLQIAHAGRRPTRPTTLDREWRNDEEPGKAVYCDGTIISTRFCMISLTSITRRQERIRMCNSAKVIPGRKYEMY